jgi:hypothetical protein
MRGVVGLIAAVFVGLVRLPGRILRALDRRGHENIVRQFHKLDVEESDQGEGDVVP